MINLKKSLKFFLMSFVFLLVGLVSSIFLLECTLGQASYSPTIIVYIYIRDLSIPVGLIFGFLGLFSKD